MADLTVTAANVGVASENDVVLIVGVAGEAIDRGEVVYYDSGVSPPKYKLAANDTANKATATGLAQSESAADGDEIIIQMAGKVKAGATLTKGEIYYVSANAGKIAPFADLLAGDYVTSVYRATSTSEAQLDFDATGTLL